MMRVIETESDMANGSAANPLAIMSTIAGDAITPSMDVASNTQNITVATWSARIRARRIG